MSNFVMKKYMSISRNIIFIINITLKKSSGYITVNSLPSLTQYNRKD